MLVTDPEAKVAILIGKLADEGITLHIEHRPADEFDPPPRYVSRAMVRADYEPSG